jgi:hypothetical protein
MGKPEFPRPSVGDELIVVVYPTRHSKRQEIPVRVKAMARFRIELEGLDGEALPWMYLEFDIRTQHVWGGRYTSSRSFGSRSERIHTPETLAYERREDAADEYLRENRVWVHDLRDGLRTAVEADPVGFANVLRRFEGLEEI